MTNNKRHITIAIMLIMFLAAFESTVVSTAMPIISKNLNGFDLISWIFSAYLLTSAISTPIYGKLSDLYGRKKTIIIGTLIFIFGSFLCALSQNMIELIIFRAIQGIGAGAIITISYVIIGDIFDLEERAKIQGLLSSVWGIAGLVGPFLGGFILDYLSWHWIFLVNVPVGLISVLIILCTFNEKLSRKEVIIDYKGIILITLTILTILFGIMKIEDNSIKCIIYVIPVIILLILFYFVERKAKEPIIPFEIFNKTTTLINIIAFIASAVMVVLETYMPIYVQSVLGYGATISGLSLLPMSISWLLSNVTLGKLLTKIGEKKLLQISTLIIFISSCILLALTEKGSLGIIVIEAIVFGYGAGALFAAITIIVQLASKDSMKGVATSTNSLIRTLGQTMGVSIFGIILNSGIAMYFKEKSMSGITSNNIYTAIESNKILVSDGSNAVFNGIHNIIIAMIAASFFGIIIAFLLPKKSIIQE